MTITEPSHVPEIGELITAHAEGRLADYFPEPTPEAVDPDEPLRGIELPEALSDGLRALVAESNKPDSRYKQKPNREGYRRHWPDLDAVELAAEWVAQGIESLAVENLGPGAKGIYVPKEGEPARAVTRAQRRTTDAERQNERTSAALADLAVSEAELRALEVDLADQNVSQAEAALAEARRLRSTVTDRHMKGGKLPQSDKRRRERAQRKAKAGKTLADKAHDDKEREKRRRGGHLI